MTTAADIIAEMRSATADVFTQAERHNWQDDQLQPIARAVIRLTDAVEMATNLLEIQQREIRELHNHKADAW